MSDDAPKTGNPKRPRRRGWRIFFSIFKWTRVALLLTLLSLIVLGIYVNRAGLPEWAHRRLVAELREKGWDAQFSRLRLRWYRGIVADQLQLSRTNTYAGPHLFVDTAEFRLNGKALRSFEVRADSVFLSGGRLIWPLPIGCASMDVTRASPTQPASRSAAVNHAGVRSSTVEATGGVAVEDMDGSWECRPRPRQRGGMRGLAPVRSAR